MIIFTIIHKVDCLVQCIYQINFQFVTSAYAVSQEQLSKTNLVLFIELKRYLEISSTYITIYLDNTTFCLCAQLLSHVQIFCNPMDCTLLGSSVHGIFQARILEWVTMSSSREASQPRDRTHVSYVSCNGRQIFYHWCHLGSPNID